MAEPKITTYATGDGYFTVEVDGRPLTGMNGGLSRFSSRAIARDEAKRRMNLLHNQLSPTLD